MNKKDRFIQNGLGCLGFKSKQDLIENLYLKAIVDSYERIDDNIGIENDIRDRFVHDFYHKSSITKNLLQTNILYINWERWVFKNENNFGRTDLTFAISGFEFIIECKRLKNASQEYINEGLNRFICQEYAENNSHSGMLGFVISGDVDVIKSGLQVKCEAECSLHNDFTKQKYDGWLHSFKTAHSRLDNSEIYIYHLFFEFKNN